MNAFLKRQAKPWISACDSSPAIRRMTTAKVMKKHLDGQIFEK